MANDVVIGSDGKPVAYEEGKGIAFSKINGSTLGTVVDKGRGKLAIAALLAGEAASALSGAGAVVGGAVMLSASAPAVQAQEMSEAQRVAMEKEARRRDGMGQLGNLYLRQFEENEMTQQRYNEFREKWNQTVNDQTFDTGEQRTRQNPTVPKPSKKGTVGRVLGEILLPDSETMRNDREAARRQQEIALETMQNDARNQMIQQQQVAQGIIDDVNNYKRERIEADRGFLNERQAVSRDYGLSPMDQVQAKRDAVAAYKELHEGKAPVEKVTPFEPVVRQRPDQRQTPEKRERDKEQKKGASLFQQEGDQGKVTVAGITFSGQAADALTEIREAAQKERVRNEQAGITLGDNTGGRGGRGGGGRSV